MPFWKRRKGTWRTIREDYRERDPEEWTEDEVEHYYQTISDDEYWQEWELWSRDTVEHRRVKKVLRSCIEVACEAGKESHPLEFASLLRVEGDTVTELVLMPGTVQGDEHAIFQMWMQPVDRTVRGTLHTHPTPHPYPSDADFELFSAHGEIHIIIGHPYRLGDWRAYSHDGTPVHLEVVEEDESGGEPD